MKILKRVGVTLLCLLLAVVLVVGGYLVYLTVQYGRIEDHAPLAVQNPQAAVLQPGTEYTALTFNIGFGAYDHDFSLFMDSGVMQDGTEVSGQYARARSRDIVLANTDGVAAAAKALDPDLLLLQEVDVSADRSHKVDQVRLLQDAFPAHASVYACNFKSAYLAYPLPQTHGAVESGLVSLSRFAVDAAERRSLPVDGSFPAKFFDLDRCFSTLRLPVDGGGQLVLINVHMTAFDEGGLVREQQMEMLAGVLAAERAAGNWVIVGGDYNHALCGTVERFLGRQQVPAWVAVFQDGMLPEGFRVVCADNAQTVATCRSSDLPWQEGVNYQAVLDGFIVSDNIAATAHNVDAGYQNSDHNPVLLTFALE